MKRAGLLALLLAGCAGPADKSDWERSHESGLARADEKIELPAYPRERDLIEFPVADAGGFRFFIDGASVNVGREIVYYTLVARSPAGAENVSFEGMRCPSVEVRTYALGSQGAWRPTVGEWRTLRGRSVQRWHNELYREYFCPQRETLASRQLVLLALRRGGPSITNSLTEDVPRGGSGAGR